MLKRISDKNLVRAALPDLPDLPTVKILVSTNTMTLDSKNSLQDNPATDVKSIGGTEVVHREETTISFDIQGTFDEVGVRRRAVYHVKFGRIVDYKSRGCLHASPFTERWAMA